MKVLVVESESGAATIASAQLERAGHEVLRCHEPGSRAFPCAGFAAGGCPLEHEAIDVVLTVRARSSSQPAPLEDGAVCALRRHLPLVVAGRSGTNPFASFPVTTAGRDVVAACEEAATVPSADHEAVAQRALDESLAGHGIDDAEARAFVRRRAGRLTASLQFPAETPERTRAMASVRVVGALRQFDPYNGGIDVSWSADAGNELP
jgi:hypothetical protein